ncbi:MAG TPA: hypothetical protein PKA64_08410 [Myxococcota bacterium]|nr:hypothetical protein [Myxococcota bacterium]
MRDTICLLPLLVGCGAPTVNASYLTEGTLSVDRLPDEVVLDSELPAPGVTPAQVDDAIDDALAALDAGDITQGTLPASVLPPEAITDGDARLGGVAGDTEVGYDANVALDSATAKVLAAITVGPAPRGVAMTAHVQLEKSGATTGRYELTIREDSCTGSPVGLAIWRPGTIDQAYNADTVSIVAFVPSLAEAATYALCGRRFDDVAPTATVGPRGLIGTW